MIKNESSLVKSNPYTNKKPCVRCGSTNRYSSRPYQCKVCQRKAVRQRQIDKDIMESQDNLCDHDLEIYGQCEHENTAGGWCHKFNNACILTGK